MESEEGKESAKGKELLDSRERSRDEESFTASAPRGVMDLAEKFSDAFADDQGPEDWTRDMSASDEFPCASE